MFVLVGFLLLKWCIIWLIWKILVFLFCVVVFLVFVKVNEEELMNIDCNIVFVFKLSGLILYDLLGLVELVYVLFEKEIDMGFYLDGY